MPFIAFDCEGPLTLNDNAFEFAKALMPKGDYFFTQISRFDDYLADIKKKSGYKAGDTLKLILPFLKLFGATNALLEEFSEKTLLLLRGVKETIPKIAKLLPTFIVSTSYRPYLAALCNRINFPLEQVFCTEVDFEVITLSPEEKRILREFYEEILLMPLIELPLDAKTPEDLPPSLRNLLDRLEEIFFERIWGMDCGYFLREVNPIGGEEKAKACREIASSLGEPYTLGFYCGDSITDCQALELLKEGGGVSLSFNGNRYALRSAEFYALSKSAYLFAELVPLFLEGGVEALRKFTGLPKGAEEFGVIPKQNEALFWELVKKSESMRKAVRGEAIGALG